MKSIPHKYIGGGGPVKQNKNINVKILKRGTEKKKLKQLEDNIILFKTFW